MRVRLLLPGIGANRPIAQSATTVRDFSIAGVVAQSISFSLKRSLALVGSFLRVLKG